MEVIFEAPLDATVNYALQINTEQLCDDIYNHFLFQTGLQVKQEFDPVVRIVPGKKKEPTEKLSDIDLVNAVKQAEPEAVELYHLILAFLDVVAFDAERAAKICEDINALLLHRGWQPSDIGKRLIKIWEDIMGGRTVTLGEYSPMVIARGRGRKRENFFEGEFGEPFHFLRHEITIYYDAILDVASEAGVHIEPCLEYVLAHELFHAFHCLACHFAEHVKEPKYGWNYIPFKQVSTLWCKRRKDILTDNEKDRVLEALAEKYATDWCMNKSAEHDKYIAHVAKGWKSRYISKEERQMHLAHRKHLIMWPYAAVLDLETMDDAKQLLVMSVYEPLRELRRFL